MNEENELDSACGVSDEELTRRFILAVRFSILQNKIKGNLIPCWDYEKKSPYILYPDGHCEYA